MLSDFYHKLSNWLALAMLALMFILMAGSVIGDSATMDELAHIPAGYSYLSERDYRLNPEHPPLAKDLSAIIPYFTFRPNFPIESAAWRDDLNGQWDMGREFLYESGNRADVILFTSRLPMIMLALFFGWLFFAWVRARYGDKVALLALFFFSFSPTFIAHSRYVTTDLAAAFAFFIGIASFIAFLERSSWPRTLIAGAALGIALLLKFSTALLLPLYALFAVLWIILARSECLNRKEWKRWFVGAMRTFVSLVPKFIILFGFAAVLIGGVYAFHVQNYPLNRQVSDTEAFLSTFGFRPAVELTVAMAKSVFWRPWAEYLLGLLMVIQRAAGGNTTYFLGDVTNTGWWYYFPVAFFLKESIPFLLLMVAAIVIAFRWIWRARQKSLGVVLEWMRDNFVLAASLIFIIVYWFESMRSPLNIGVRHVLPTFPFIYLLVSRELIRAISHNAGPDSPRTLWEWVVMLYRRYIKKIPRYFALSALLAWLALEAIVAFPNYLSYYNEFAGGSANGYRYIVDSNYDWGQDLKRLASFVEKNRIEKIGVDYFGGGSPAYYLGPKFVSWWSARGAPDSAAEDPQWIAVSASTLMGAQARPTHDLVVKPEDSYAWLKDRKPVARAGYSIFIYKF